MVSVPLFLRGWMEGNQPSKGPLVPENFRKVLEDLEGFIGY